MNESFTNHFCHDHQPKMSIIPKYVSILTVFLPKRGHQPFSCPMATEYDGRGQLSERYLYFLAIHISYPQRKTFDAGLLRLTGSDRIYIFLHHIQEQRFCLHRKIIVRPNRKKQKNFYQETGISLYVY